VFKISRFQDLSKDKVTIMSRLITDQNICKAIYYNEANFLDQPDIVDPAKSLIYKNVFPYRFIPEPDKEEHTYVTLSFRRYKPVGSAFKSGLIYIYTFTHKDLVTTDYGVLRYDYIVSEIDKLINMQRGIGIGKAEFYEMDEFIVNEKYLGQYVAYKLYEFN
jgi:hypothetical protein